MEPVSRRNFLKIAGITLGASVISCSGLSYAATRSPKVDTPELQLGVGDPTAKRTLVTYATRAGSTVEIAAAIGAALAARGFMVDILPVKENPKVEGYQVVLVGSAIRMGGWLPEAVEFLQSNQETLNGLPVALFTVHGNNLGTDEQSQKNRETYLDAVRPLVQPIDTAFFAGKIDPGKLSLLDRLITQVVKSPTGDFRDWDQIHAWAESLAA